MNTQFDPRSYRTVNVTPSAYCHRTIITCLMLISCGGDFPVRVDERDYFTVNDRSLHNPRAKHPLCAGIRVAARVCGSGEAGARV